MEEQVLDGHNEPKGYNGHNGFRASSTTLRDFLAAGFRQRRLIAFSFVGVFLGAILCALLLPAQYEARMKILVKRERVDPIVTTEASAVRPIANDAVTEEDLNSEVELLKSRDLLEQVVLACGLGSRGESSWTSLLGGQGTSNEVRMARAVRQLAKDLRVELLQKSNIIAVTYASSDPALSARVLTALSNDYLAKHLSVHRPAGALDFFQQQTERYRQELTDAEAKLAHFGREQTTVATPVERDMVLQKYNDFDATLRQTQAEIAASRERIREIEVQEDKISPRLSTTDRKADNAQLMEQLKWTLLNLELKHTELLSKFDPSYPLVREVDAEITQTKAAIAKEETAPVREETTDRNPTYQWLSDEQAKAKVDLASLQARFAAMQRIVQAYRDKSLLLDQRNVEQQDLLRTVKVEEANFLLYLNKREEARISDALDSKRIVNVAIAETATVPALPVHSPLLLVLVGGVLAVVVSLGSAFASEYMNPSFRTADEVEETLNIPVLAAMPKDGS